jgi:endonuclease/exonuclease/phosphatase family metal-dependent hydrolase
VLIRTWNLHLGNTIPPSRKAHVQEMIELITADKPDIVALQEVPFWALRQLGEWSGGMQVASARAKRPKLGPIPIPRSLGRFLAAPNAGKRSKKYAGKANAILFPKEAVVRSHKTITLNTNPFVEDRGALFGLSKKQMLWWERERRVCQVLQYEMPDRQRYLVANLHATSTGDLRIPDAELRRAINFILRASDLEEAVIVLGDFNILRDKSTTISELMNAPREDRWMTSGPQVDYVLLRRAINTSVRVWSEQERAYDSVLLSNNPPIEATVELRLKT